MAKLTALALWMSLGRGSATGILPIELPDAPIEAPEVLQDVPLRMPTANNIDAIFKTGRQSFLRDTLGEKEPGMEHWILSVRQSALQARVAKLFSIPGMSRLTEIGQLLLGFRGTLAQMEALAKVNWDIVEWFEPDAEVTPRQLGGNGPGNDDDTPWGVARVGARQQDKSGMGVHVYVFDTGIRCTHDDFGGRAVPTLQIISRTEEECGGLPTTCGGDVHGHGSHCAGTATGRKYGVAPNAQVHAIKILSDAGGGALSWSTRAMGWLASNIGNAKAPRPAVASMSIGSAGVHNSDKVGIDGLVAVGIPVVVAAGNDASDACRESPAYVPAAITVGASEERDRIASFSNYGTCIDLFAPGTWTLSVSPATDVASTTMSGTSMACPHVAGAFAVAYEELREQDPGFDPTDPGSRQFWETTVVTQKSVQDAIQGDQKNSPATILLVGGTYNPTCQDTPDFRDAWGFSCIWWVVSTCTFTFILPYSEAALADARMFCKSSCRICQAPTDTL